MTSLIFWGPYLAHKSVISHRREKQRLKNYERWEDLRDDYDEQRKLSRESRSLDIQRTGPWDSQAQQQQFSAYPDEPTHCMTLRDQQEANDARLGWRPQEAWDGPKTQLQAQMTGQTQYVPQPSRHNMPLPPQRHISMAPSLSPTPHQHPPMTSSYSTNQLPMRAQKTGATWDEGLPTPLPVSRQSFDDYDHSQRYRATATQSVPVSRDASLSRRLSVNPPQQQYDAPQARLGRQTSVSRTPSTLSRTQTPSGLRDTTPAVEEVTTIVELPKNEFGFVEPVRGIAGGRMAELIERGY